MSRKSSTKRFVRGANTNQNQAFEDDLGQGQGDDYANDGVEATDPYDIREYRYRHKDGRYYYDRRPTDAPGSVDEGLDYDAKWEAGDHSSWYEKERDRVLRAASRAETTDAGEGERKLVGNKKTFTHYLKNIEDKFDPNAKPLFKKESPHEREGRVYLTRHKILELFNNVTTLMLVQRPESPTQFLINHFESLMAVRESYPPAIDARKTLTETSQDESEIVTAVAEADAQLPLVFNEDNIRSTLTMMNPTGKTATTRKKFKHALTVLGFPVAEAGDGDEEDVIDEDAYITTMRRLATDQAKTFYPRVLIKKEETPSFADVFIQ